MAQPSTILEGFPFEGLIAIIASFTGAYTTLDDIFNKQRPTHYSWDLRIFKLSSYESEVVRHINDGYRLVVQCSMGTLYSEPDINCTDTGPKRSCASLHEQRCSMQKKKKYPSTVDQLNGHKADQSSSALPPLSRREETMHTHLQFITRWSTTQITVTAPKSIYISTRYPPKGVGHKSNY